MATKSSTPQLNYGIYTFDRYGKVNSEIFDGDKPARFVTLAEAQAALPRLQAIEDDICERWLPAGVPSPKLVVSGRGW